MTNYIVYLFEANCTLLLCGLFYYLFLQKETDFKGKRFYILGSALLSLIVPLLSLNFLLPEDPTPIQGMQALILPEIVIGQAGEPETIQAAASSTSWYTMVYIVGAIILSGWFLFQIGQVIWFYTLNYNRKHRKAGYTLLETHGTLPTFSFFRVLFLDNSVPLNETDEARIIAHEEAHIREFHSVDIVLLEITKIMFWFNPVAWFFRREVQDIHEYLADAASTTETTTDEYSSLLAKMALNKAHLPIGHHFNKSKTLKRIKMMKTTKTKIKNWKWLSTLSMVAIILVAFSCNDEVMSDVEKVMDESAVSVNVPAEMQQLIDRLKENDPDGEYVYLETSMDNLEEVKRMKALDAKTIAHMNVNKTDNILGMIVKKNGTTDLIIEKHAESNGDVFMIVEEPAEPEGGMAEFYKYIATNILYPQEARKAGIQGKVYVQMIIDKDGSITEVEVMKGIGYGCDEEAQRVIAAAPQWKPAKQRGKLVKQRIVVPIAFALDGAEGSDDPAHIIIEEAEPGGQMDVEANIDGDVVWGKVKDENGNAMAGVNVVIEGTNSGTVTDLDGSYKIKMQSEDQKLHFTFVGYKSVKVGLDD